MARNHFATATLLLSFLAGCSAYRHHRLTTAEDLVVLRDAVDSVMTRYLPSPSCDGLLGKKLALREEAVAGPVACNVRLSRIDWSVDRQHALVYVEVRSPLPGGTLIELERDEGGRLGFKEWRSYQTIVVD